MSTSDPDPVSTDARAMALRFMHSVEALSPQSIADPENSPTSLTACIRFVADCTSSAVAARPFVESMPARHDLSAWRRRV